jgi:hypothetical protein
MWIFKYNKILTVILIIVAAFLILVIGTAANELWKGYKWQKSVDQFQESLEKPYKDDVYGGKTPEETWAMFLDALKKEDLDLASKYYDAGHQGKAKEWLEKLKQDGEIEQTIGEMEGLKKSKSQPLSKEKVYYSYNVFSRDYQQKLTERVIFYLNPYTKVWKIVW